MEETREPIGICVPGGTGESAEGGGQPNALAGAILSVDLVYRRVADYAETRSLIRLSITCTALRHALARDSAYVFAGLPVRLLGRRGLTKAIASRWRRFAGPELNLEAELDGALLGAAEGGRAAAVKWLLCESAPATTAPRLTPSVTAIDAAFVAFVDHGSACDFLQWFLGESAQRPTLGAVKTAFLKSCAAGKLGYAQVMYRSLASTSFLDRQTLLVGAIEATQDITCHRHVETWAREVLSLLEIRWGVAPVRSQWPY